MSSSAEGIIAKRVVQFLDALNPHPGKIEIASLSVFLLRLNQILSWAANVQHEDLEFSNRK